MFDKLWGTTRAAVDGKTGITSRLQPRKYERVVLPDPCPTTAAILDDLVERSDNGSWVRFPLSDGSIRVCIQDADGDRVCGTGRDTRAATINLAESLGYVYEGGDA